MIFLKKYDITQPIVLKSGVYDLNTDSNFNYQLNRVINWDGGRIEDIASVSQKIHTSADWKRELIALGDKAVEDGRTENAIAYYRMSEFFMYDGDPDKKKYYELATEMFYEYYADYFGDESPIIERYAVPYLNAKLPVMHVKPQSESKGILLIHGGNDSYYEEFLFSLLYLRELGYEAYLFEGPGQGGVIRLQSMHFTHEWEKPVKAVLDYFSLEDVTIIGVSLGGYLAPRAAAFDKRISRVVAWSIFPCFFDIMLSYESPAVQKFIKTMVNIGARPVINGVYGMLAKKMPVIDWGLKHGMFAYEADDAYGYAKKLKLYDIAPIADRVTQDIFIIGANKDHFINYHLIGEEIDMFVNAKSLTFRLFTDKEGAENHCNVGNGRIVFDAIDAWIETLKKR